MNNHWSPVANTAELIAAIQAYLASHGGSLTFFAGGGIVLETDSHYYHASYLSADQLVETIEKQLQK